MKSGATFTEETIDIIRWSKENNKPNIHPRNKKMELCSGLRRDWERQNNFQYDIDNLIVKEAYCGKQIIMKRFRARAKGRAAPILKPYSNVTIILSEKNKMESHGTKS